MIESCEEPLRRAEPPPAIRMARPARPAAFIFLAVILIGHHKDARSGPNSPHPQLGEYSLTKVRSLNRIIT